MKKKYIIFFLVGIFSVMAIAFAAFSTTLNITGTASIDSNWKIKINNVVTEVVKGKAQNESTPIVTDTSVTFKTLLYIPSDSIKYKVTVVNEGSIDAKLDSIEMTDSKNPAINFDLTNINENSVLKAGDSTDFNVIVTYNEDVETQPTEENLTASLTVKLNYVQNA